MNIEKIRKSLNENKLWVCIFIYLSFLSVYVLYRAHILSITHDEAITFFSTLNDYADIFNYNHAILSNNHLLNTLLVKFFVSYFGISEFVVRIPALFGFIIYILYSARLSRLALKGYFVPVGIVILTLNPFVVDFFSLARGYSLALGFFMASLFYFFNGIKRRKGLDNYFSSFFGALSVLTNLSFLSPFISILALKLLIDTLCLYNDRKKHFFRYYLGSLMPAIIAPYILFATIGGQISKMISAGEFYAGGDTGFFTDTGLSLVNASLYFKQYLDGTGTEILVLLISLFFIGTAYSAVGFVRNKNPDKFLIAVIAMLAVLYLSIELQHMLFGTLFVIERTAIYFIPAYSIFLVYFLMVLSENKKLFSKKRAFIPALVLLPIMLHYLLCLNLSHSYSWKYCADVKDAMYYLDEFRNQRGREHISFGNNWKLEPSMNFYKVKNGYDWMDWSTRQGPVEGFDIYFLIPEDQVLTSVRKLETLKTYTVSGLEIAVPGR